MIPSLRKYQDSEVAQKKLAMIQFFDKHGEIATKEAFGADRKVISRWRQRLASSNGRLSSLVPHKTTPHSLRTPNTNIKIVEFIKDFREKHPLTGKEKLKPDVNNSFKMCMEIV
ncbi:MAG: hypothetical protein KJ914_18840 [Gammaproteobacteria bacterium]|nr:hypothetical protein [Gammaproteobacteria bacterium]